MKEVKRRYIKNIFRVRRGCLLNEAMCDAMHSWKEKYYVYKFMWVEKLK
jgi:hypothetical protein